MAEEISLEETDYDFPHKHLLGLADYSKDDIQYVLEQAQYFREILDRPVPKFQRFETRRSSIFFMRIAPVRGFLLSWHRSGWGQM